jgi:hypothetical protein
MHVQVVRDDRNERDIRSREEERRERNKKQADKTLLRNRKARSAAGKFLFGVECAGCGSPFVQKAPPAREGRGGKEPGDPQVPSTTNAVYCCNNLHNRNGTSEEGCSHANCKLCWDAAVLKASKIQE